MTDTFKELKGNKIQHRMTEQAFDKGDMWLQEVQKTVDEYIGKPKRVSQIFNNTVQPTLEEIVFFSQILEVQIEELLVLR